MTEAWPIIDAHAHFLPEEAIAVAKTGGSSGFSGIPGARGIEGTLRFMEDAGVDMTVLTMSAVSFLGLNVCKAINDGYAKIMREYPRKFVLCGQVPLQQGQDVADEIDRCISELGLNGISLVSSFPEVTLDSPELWPLYEKINELNVPIIVHPTVRVPLWGGTDKYQMGSTVAREYDMAKAVIEVMYGVLKDFPELKFLMSHYGGGMPALKARIRAWFEPEGWDIADEFRNRAKTPRELDELGLARAFDELFDKLYFDMAGSGEGWMPMIKVGLLTIRTDRTCFGTDYPFEVHNAEDIRSFIDNIKQLDIPDAEKRLMLGENIKHLFQI